MRASIEKHQPLVGLHGHIHESKGFVRIGRTICLNPGSEYGDGILRGAIVNLEGNKVKEFLLTERLGRRRGVRRRTQGVRSRQRGFHALYTN